jgi:prepilin-type N-terminal cleavage/methylation domain-containing protein
MPSNRPAGFSLIEIVVVLMILSIATVITVPAFLSTRELSDLDLATERVELLLRIARDSAVKTAMPVTVVVDSATALVWLTTPTSIGMGTEGSGMGSAGSALMGAGVAAAAPNGPGSSIDLPPGVRMEVASARARFEFQPSGQVFPDTIYLRSGASARLITVNPWTGHVVAY